MNIEISITVDGEEAVARKVPADNQTRSPEGEAIEAGAPEAGPGVAAAHEADSTTLTRSSTVGATDAGAGPALPSETAAPPPFVTEPPAAPVLEGEPGGEEPAEGIGDVSAGPAPFESPEARDTAMSEAVVVVDDQPGG